MQSTKSDEALRLHAETRTAIERAFKRLRIRPKAAGQLPGIIDLLAGLEGRVAQKTPNRFLPISSRGAKRELVKLARLANSLADQIDSLHEPTVVALADAQIFTAQVSSEDFRKIARGAESARTRIDPSLTGTRGRPRNFAAAAVADIVTAYYRNLTGKRPTITTDWETNRAGGTYFRLVKDVFAALKMNVSVESAVRSQIVKRKSKRRKQSHKS